MPLAQGLLTDRYLDGIPVDSRAGRPSTLPRELITDEVLAPVRRLDKVARDRGQTLAQMALAWTLRDPRVTSTLVGVSSVAQLRANLGALDRLEFDDAELASIDRALTGR
jgi:L-glyceraldehyde 3-phosphate reductase